MNGETCWWMRWISWYISAPLVAVLLQHGGVGHVVGLRRPARRCARRGCRCSCPRRSCPGLRRRCRRWCAGPDSPGPQVSTISSWLRARYESRISAPVPTLSSTLMPACARVFWRACAISRRSWSLRTESLTLKPSGSRPRRAAPSPSRRRACRACRRSRRGSRPAGRPGGRRLALEEAVAMPS